MLASAHLVAFVPATDLDGAHAFYEGVLGLRLVSADAFAVVFDANGVMLRVTDVSRVPQFRPQPFAVLGWEVLDVRTTVRALVAKGVAMKRYAGLPQDDDGIWTSPTGAQVAWFSDPDGNVLSATQSR